MSKRAWHVVLLGVGSLFLLILAIIWQRERIVLSYYATTALPYRELTPRWVRPAFHFLTEEELPRSAEGLRAIFFGGREPSIFVRFQTDAEGIAYISRTFDKPAVTSQTLDADYLKALTASNASAIRYTPWWPQGLYDQNCIDSARLFKYWPSVPKGLAYELLIDAQHGTVYIFAVSL
ncbi:MAG: hypothetical protein JSU70_20510 [Phycisphaerales bacterium]|nr:MAG: hypothetical protein JSU70_20510 [Phycisphaerales bacterium]